MQYTIGIFMCYVGLKIYEDLARCWTILPLGLLLDNVRFIYIKTIYVWHSSG